MRYWCYCNGSPLYFLGFGQLLLSILVSLPLRNVPGLEQGSCHSALSLGCRAVVVFMVSTGHSYLKGIPCAAFCEKIQRGLCGGNIKSTGDSLQKSDHFLTSESFMSQSIKTAVLGICCVQGNVRVLHRS